jgi:NAD(P)H dehydrogenase (quinone)
MFGFTKKKKIFILLGQEDKDGTYCSSMANEYESAAREYGHEVRRANIGDLAFDPLLHKGYKTIQALEPDLKKLQEDIRWSDHVVIVYPTWWGSMPAILKGLFDRVWLPGFAFHFHPMLGWDKLLHGRTGRVITTMDNGPLVERMLFGDFTNEISRAILGFSGISVSVTEFGSVKNASEHKKAMWLKKAASLGKRAK